MLSQFRRTVMFSGVVITALLVAIASIVFSGHQMNRLIAIVFPSTPNTPIRQLWQTPESTSTVSLNQVSNGLSSAWIATQSAHTILTQNHQDGLSACNCPVCQGITV